MAETTADDAEAKSLFPPSANSSETEAPECAFRTTSAAAL